MNEITQPAIWDDTHMAIDQSEAVLQVGLEQVCRFTVDGVEFRSWLPNSREEADQINAVAARLTGATLTCPANSNPRSAGCARPSRAHFQHEQQPPTP